MRCETKNASEAEQNSAEMYSNNSIILAAHLDLISPPGYQVRLVC